MALRILSCLGDCNRVSQIGCSSTTKVCYLAVLKARSPKSKCEQGWVHLRAMRAGCVLGLLLAYIGCFLVSVWHLPSLLVSGSKCPLSIRIPVIIN